MTTVTNRNVWFISDTHFGHAKVIEYCNRPFANIQEMDKELIKRWNAKVKSRDLVWHLGDFALANKEYVAEIVSKLNGEIRLIKGNHDTRSSQWFRTTQREHPKHVRRRRQWRMVLLQPSIDAFWQTSLPYPMG